MKFYKKIKIITGTSSKPELFEEKINELLRELDDDERIEDYNINIFFSEGSVLCIVELKSNKRWEKKNEHNN